MWEYVGVCGSVVGVRRECGGSVGEVCGSMWECEGSSHP